MKKPLRPLFLLMLCLVLTALPATAFGASSPTTKTPAADLRTTMAKLHGEHAYYTIIAMQKRFDNAPDAAAAMRVVTANSNALTTMVSDVYGQTAAKNFRSGWDEHVALLMNYVDATIAKNSNKRQEAKSALEDNAETMAALLNKLNPKLDRETLEKHLLMHEQLLLQSFNAYVTGKYDTAYTTAHKAYVHTATIGAMMATGIVKQFPNEFKGTTTQTDAAYLRQQMGQGLGEHTILSILVLQKAHDKAPDYANAKAALDKNTAALTATHRNLFGAGAAKTFNEQWNRHIADYQAYLQATLAGNEAGRKAAKADLGDFVATITAFQVGRLPLDKTMTYQANAMHGAHVITAIESYHNTNYSKTYEALRIGYNHMWMTGNVLSEAVVKKMPGEF
ncbi:hypothetical protein [Saccharibacillus kuerlensis]|uniref:Copper amine oxidase n=1 Tax=Saccharibacillus kuerlensis TaxID=459527 RepID=A0ABQ2KVB7_9BACL|nr:hypothetical protein [Saccharibacillus kuerlensis]GGN94405.1 hypothetical protein GCM10010969_09130 [Saccharibacillus kuerlensis]